MDKNVKNALAAIGAVSLVAAVPMLAAGVAIGAVVANPDKAKKTVKDLAGRVEAGLNKYGVFDDLAEEGEGEGEAEAVVEETVSKTEEPESEPTPNGGWII